MSTPGPGLTGELTRQLRAQVAHVYGSSLTLGDVQGRAHTIRRRRSALSGGGAAVAMLAVIVPVGLTLDDPSSRTPVAEDSPTVDAPVLGVPYLAGRQLVLPDGTGRELARSYQGGVVLGDTLLGLRNDESGWLALDELDDEGRVLNSVVTESGVTYNAEASAVAYVTDDELIVRWADGVASLGDVGDATPLRLIGGPDCTEGPARCAVYVNDELGGAHVITNAGPPQLVPGDPLSVTDVAEDGRVAMVTSYTEQPEPGSCSSVLAPGTTSQIHASCDYTYGRFSPDGALLSASHPYLDGFGMGWLAILDAETGGELARYESGSGGITGSVWEDDTHLLITSREDGRWRVTRLGSDGAELIVLGPTRGSGAKPSYAVLGAGF